MMLLSAAVAQRGGSGGRFRDSAATVDGIRRTMLIIAGMTDRINSRTSRAFGVRATAAGAESWPAGAGAGATAADAGARNCATTIFTPALTTTISPTSARPIRTIIETLDMGTLPPSKLPVQPEVEHLAMENLPAADVHEELPLVGGQRARGRVVHAKDQFEGDGAAARGNRRGTIAEPLQTVAAGEHVHAQPDVRLAQRRRVGVAHGQAHAARPQALEDTVDDIVGRGAGAFARPLRPAFGAGGRGERGLRAPRSSPGPAAGSGRPSPSASAGSGCGSRSPLGGSICWSGLRSGSGRPAARRSSSPQTSGTPRPGGGGPRGRRGGGGGGGARGPTGG